MADKEGGSGKRKLGLVGCLAFWVLAAVGYYYMRKTPMAMETFATLQGWITALRADSPWYVSVLLGLVAISPLGLIWLIWRRLKRKGER
jgi:hypothetical protein